MSIPIELSGRDLPHLVFRDLTERGALQFDALDPTGRLFHVVVIKERFRPGAPDASGLSTLIADELPVPLNDEDVPHDGEASSSIREESDLAPYKRYCDVLVVGHAYAPGHQPVPSFLTRLRLFSPKASRAQPGSADEATPMREAFDVLIDKSLVVHGPRWWQKTASSPSPVNRRDGSQANGSQHWRLTAPEAVTHCALRPEHSFGGGCRIDVGDSRADDVPVVNRLREDQLLAHPDAGEERPRQPLAHEVSPFNPLGTGFTRAWYLSATGLDRVPAHRLELAQRPVTVDDFWHVMAGRESIEPAGFGVVERGWQPRVAWIGTERPDESKLAAGLGLNQDFDFRYWNCAPSDQQCAPLHGGERLVLDNLWPPAHPASRMDANGQRRVMLELPRRELMLMASDEMGELQCLAPVIDTVVVDTEGAHIDICWRWRVDASLGLREARLIEASTPGQVARLAQLRRVLARPLPDDAPDAMSAPASPALA